MSSNQETYFIKNTFSNASPFIVVNDKVQKTVTVKNNTETKTYITIPYDQIWLGDKFLDEETDTIRDIAPGEEGYGHAVLIKLKDEPNKYVFIQDKIRMFEAGNIDTFYSVMGVFDLPLSYAGDEQYIYFFHATEDENITKFLRSNLPNTDQHHYMHMFQLINAEHGTLPAGLVPVPSQDYVKYAIRMKKNIRGKIATVSTIPFVSNLSGRVIPNNIESHIGTFLSGKEGTLNQQKVALNKNYAKFKPAVGGKRKTIRQRKSKRRTHRRRQ